MQTADHPTPAQVRPDRQERTTYGLQLFAVCAALTALALKQAPARLVGDTKLDLAIAPLRLMSRALHLWDPSRDFGVTQNQNYGYLFPMGPFFAIGRGIGLPAWAVQRLWWALLLCVAFLGLVRLAEALGMGTRTSRLLGGLAFALSPRVLSTLGPISVESLPYCLAPWVLLPLVRGGSPRRAAARSAVAVLCMGAVNAVAVLAALPPAVLWLLTREPGPARRRLMAWWAGCVLLACAWWLVPLLLLGRYSPPFLDFIESASTTTAVTSLVEVLRGTSDWIAYVFSGGSPVWPAGFALLTHRLVIAYTVVVVLAGLAGLLRRDLPERLWLTGCLLLGVAGVTAGHLGDLQGALAPWLHGQLDGALAPLRNVHKLDVVVRLPLVLGLVHGVGRLMTPVAALDAARRQRIVVTVAAAAAVLGAALPALSPGLAPRRPFVEVPGYWQETADWLGRHGDRGRALLLPGSSFPDYLWGSSNDEPMQPLARSEWAVRGAIPLTPAGTIRALDAIEQQLAAGEPAPGLAEALARMGVGFVVVRNDLAYAAAGSTRPLLVHEALNRSDGISRVAAFGPEVGGGNGTLVDEGLEVPYRAVEVFAVGSPAPRAQLTALSDAVVLAGGPEATVEQADMLGSRPSVLAQDATGHPELAGLPVVVTDTLRRREVQFGQLTDNRSATLSATDPLRLHAPARDYLPPGSAGHETVARLIGARSVIASSSSADAASFGGAQPEHAPYAAVDGDPATSWRSDPGKGLDGATWRIDLDGAPSLAGVTVHLGGLPAQWPRRVRLSTSAGSRTLAVPSDGVLTPDSAATSFLAITAVAARHGGLGSLDISEVTGLTVRRTLDVPPAEGADQILLAAAPGRRDACYPLGGTALCSTGLGRRGEEATGLDRTLHLTASGSYTVRAAARPVYGAALNALLDQGLAAQVTASSSAVPDPAARPGTVYDGDLRTGWRAGLTDPHPTLELRWPRPRRVAGLQLTVGPSLAASRPGRVTIKVAGRLLLTARLDGEGFVRLPDTVTDRLSVELGAGAVGGSVDPSSGQVRLLPLGVSELTVLGPGHPLVPLDGAAPPDTVLRISCSAGPVLRIGDQLLRTRLSVSRDAVTGGRLLPLTLCDDRRVTVGSGTEVVAPSTALLEPAALSLAQSPLPPAAAPLPLGGATWRSNSRDLRVADRAAPALLQVHENINPGWVATLHGQRLAAVTVDGWQQGWVLPAGSAGVVHLRYAPDPLYRRALLVGGLLALLLLVLARVGGRVGVAALSSRRTAWWHVALLAGVLALIGGLPALALAGVALVVGRLVPERVAVLVGLGAVASAGGLLVLHPWGTAGYPARGTLSQALCLTGLALVWSVLARGRGTLTGRGRQFISGRSR